MFCANCGKELLEKSKFCLYCGTKVLSTENGNTDTKSNISKGDKQKGQEQGGTIGTVIEEDKKSTGSAIIGGGENRQLSETVKSEVKPEDKQKESKVKRVDKRAKERVLMIVVGIFVVLISILLVSYFSKDSFPQMTMKTKASEVNIFLLGEGKVTIDWGDGKSSKGMLEDESFYTYSYSGSSTHTIKITGESVTWLDCSDNQLTSLDVSKNIELEELWCSENQLTKLDVGNNPMLTLLFCNGNQLTKLNVSGCKKLENLYCYGNQLTSLDVSKNTMLKELICSFNHLTNLNVSNNSELKILYCGKNKLKNLDVRNNKKLDSLSCGGNQLTKLDVSNNKELKRFRCDDNQLTSLDVSKNRELINLYCYGNQLTSLDVSKNTMLKELICSFNQLTSLNVRTNRELKYLNCKNNQLTSLDVSKNPMLDSLSCRYNQLTSLDVSKNTILQTLWFSENQLTKLDVGNNPMLTLLFCNGNQLTSAALNALFGTLHSNRGYINIEGNPGEEDCNRSIAKNKGWSFFSGEFNDKEEEDPFNSTMSEREKIKAAGYKELKVYQYDYKAGEIDKGSKRLLKEDLYDKEGNVINRILHSDEYNYTKIEYKYNKANMLIETNYHYMEGRAQETRKYYKDNITIAEKIIEEWASYSGKTIYKYDDKGNEILWQYYAGDYDEDYDYMLLEESETTNTYNNKNQLVKKEIYNDTQSNTTIITYEYDKNGNILYEKDGKGNIITSYKYNDKGLLVESPPFNLIKLYVEDLGLETWNDIFTNSISNYKYNNKGFLIEQKIIVQTTNERLIFKYSYNDRNLLKEWTRCNENEKPIRAFICEYK